MIEAANLELEMDLRDFVGFLNQQGIQHRVVEESGRQIIYVATPEQASYVQQALASWQSDGWRQEAERVAALPTRRPKGVVALLWESPVTALLIAACVAVAVISALGARVGRVDFLFYPPVAVSSVWALLADMSGPGEWLRSLTPMFLHFGELHLVFNMLWLWYFGRQLEANHPRWMFVLVIIGTSFISNTTQYLVAQGNNFGGMSGVVYGLVGYAWLIHTFMPRSQLMIPTNMFGMFVVALVLMEVFASSWIATAAHVGGLLSGLAIAALVVLTYRGLLHRDAISRRP